jgi:hypothetical protein
MNDSAQFDQIVAKLRLKSDVTLALVCLDEFLTSFFNSNNNVNLGQLFNKLPKDLPAVFTEIFLKDPVTPENKVVYKNKAEALTLRLNNCKYVQMTLAFQPDENTISVFSEWVKKNVGFDTMIDLQFDQSIVGGAQIVAGGLYKDYSVRKNLAGRFQIQREEIMGMLK